MKLDNSRIVLDFIWSPIEFPLAENAVLSIRNNVEFSEVHMIDIQPFLLESNSHLINLALHVSYICNKTPLPFLSIYTLFIGSASINKN